MNAPGDLTGLAIVVLAALVCGLVMTRLRQPAVVGYIFAGVLLGPSAFGLVQDRENVAVLAELGVLMLLFLVGMQLSLRGFKEVWKVALGAAALQIATGVGLALLLAQMLGWSLGMAVVLGFVIALSSTAVVVKMLEQINILRQPVGRLTIGILIAQDLAVVPMLLTVGAMAEASITLWQFLRIGLSVVILTLMIISLSRRKRLVLPFSGLVGGHFDLRPLAGLGYCFGGAAISGLLGLSPVFGAFLAGLVIGNSTARASMIRSTWPIQSVLLMVFFLSIGLLIDLTFIWEYLGTVLLLLFVVTVLKTVLNVGILHLLREPWPHAFIAGALLAQIGEFSLILGQAGVDAGLISTRDGQLVIAVTAFSLLFSPLWLLAARRLLRVVLLSVTSWQGTVDVIGGPQARALYRVGGRLAARLRAQGPSAAQAASGRGVAGLVRLVGMYLRIRMLRWLDAVGRLAEASERLLLPAPAKGDENEPVPAKPAGDEQKTRTKRATPPGNPAKAEELNKAAAKTGGGLRPNATGTAVRTRRANAARRARKGKQPKDA